MPGGRKALDESDFPLKVEQSRIKTKHDVPVEIAENEYVAQDIAARLNHDAWRQLEDKWSL